MIVILEEQFTNAISGQVLLKRFRKAPLTLNFHTVFGNKDYFEKLLEIEPGVSITYHFSNGEISSLPEQPSLLIPKIAISSNSALKRGELIETPGPRPVIARITNIQGAWVKAEHLYSWIKGKKIELKTTLIDKFPITGGNTEESEHMISLYPF
ncbi:MAG: hypothetical protein IPM37_18510 [Hahellaceae bacterium]|nr:hypothetical protein [Hahellaceae bacterium]